MDPIALYFTGTAGAGKTTLTKAFQNWMETAGYDAVTVNLDPGMENPSFDPDVDIRDWVRLQDVMAEYHLGPNGAQVAASDLIALKVFEVRDALERLRADYILVDTPGQVELFAFRESSRAIVEALSGDRSLLVFLFDPALARQPAGFISLLMLSATVQFRFTLPLLSVVAKEDVLTEPERTEMGRWSQEPFTLYEAVHGEGETSATTLSSELFRTIESMGPIWPQVFASAEKNTGLEDLYAAAQRTFAGGEDLEKSGGDASE